MKITETGLKAAIARCNKLAIAIRDIPPKVVYQTAETVATRARQITPVDSGALRSTIHVEPKASEIAHTGLEAKASIVAGGPVGGGGPFINSKGEAITLVNYAKLVHEDPTMNHTTGQFKYIEQPWAELNPTVPGKILKAVTEAASGSGSGSGSGTRARDPRTGRFV